MLRVGELAGIQVGHQRAGALVAALAAAVDNAGDVAGSLQRLASVDEALRGPGVGFFINVLQRVRRLEVLPVDDHAVRGHAQRILEILSVRVVARGFHRGAGGDDVILRIRPQVADVQHFAGGAPVGHQALRAFHDDVRRGLRLDGAGHLIIAGGVVQILHIHRDFGMNSVEVGDDALHRGIVHPAADGIGPQGNGHVVIRQRQG